ncbi:PucR family transcriptional regulator [Corynebacterium alimapuense]|uniref:PucR family transcriptional regulator n=1 Tax=Corynebacterium alimapuense TaxID=1576874 RepID=A0A3M8K9V8_9CORY|nr:PucR family transcriptional regulator [Corynebacterium alimapuense]RNE49314.1 PucR family transcriptional regulator [Corynebacterium alimapuense]
MTVPEQASADSLSARPDRASTSQFTPADLVSTVTVRDVLGLSVMTLAHVEVQAAHGHLGRIIRWVHVAESPRAGKLLNGGELLLTTGIGLGSDEATLKSQIAQFARAGAAALLVELGTYWEQIPETVIKECERNKLPLLVAHRELRFVTVTEQVHSRILNDQFAQISAMRDVSESFWALMFNGAPPEQLVVHTSRQLGCPVVLEDLSHRVVYYAEGHELPSELLADWEKKSRFWSVENRHQGLIAEPIRVQDPQDSKVSWESIDIQAQGSHWGRLYYRGVTDNPAEGAHVLRHAAMALAIERLGSGAPHSWNGLIDRVSLNRLMSNRFTTIDGERTVLEAAGFPTRGRKLLALDIRFHGQEITAEQVRRMLESSASRSFALASTSPEHQDRISCAWSLTAESNLEASCLQLADRLKSMAQRVSVVVSSELTGPVDLSSALHQVKRADYLASANGVHLFTVSKQRIDGLMHSLRGDVRVQAFVDSTLEPLILHDDRNGTDLLQTLEAILRFPTSRSAAADALHLSRTALYSRISTIERLLKVDLGDGNTQFTLALAIRARA